jgi:hypothetical protein
MKSPLFKSIRLFFLSAMVLGGCSQCKHKDATPAPQPAKTGQYYFHFHTNIDTNETDLGDTVKTADGRSLVLQQARIYVSNIRLVKADGSSYLFKGTQLLKTVDQEEFFVGDAPQGNYSTVSFDVGVDSVSNAIAPSASTDTIFSHHGTDMWFGSVDKGYIFLNFSGTIDSSVNKNKGPTYPFSYQIGKNSLKKTVTMPTRPFTLADGYITHVTIDYGKLFSGINIKTENKTATWDNLSLATKIANNIPSMFSYEE